MLILNIVKKLSVKTKMEHKWWKCWSKATWNFV